MLLDWWGLRKSLSRAILIAATGCGSSHEVVPSAPPSDSNPAGDASAMIGNGNLVGDAGDAMTSDDARGAGSLADAASASGDSGGLCTPACAGNAQCIDGLCQLCAGDGGSCSCLVSCDGQIVGRGDGTMWLYSDLQSAPAEVLGLDGGPLIASSFSIESGAGVCTVTLARNVLCWDLGAIASGDGGAADAGPTTPTPVLTAAGGPPLSNIVQVVKAMDGDVTCALDATGGVWCWGSNFFGTLGNGTTTDSPLAGPVLVAAGGAPLTGVVKVAVSSARACALDVDGTLWCWGATAELETPPPSVYAIQVTSLPDKVTDVAVSIFIDCAAILDGSVWCWGEPEGFGPSTQTDVDDPFEVTYQGFDGLETASNSMLPLAGIVKLAAEDNALCVLTAAGGIWCNGGAGIGLTPAGARFMGRGVGLPCLIDSDGAYAISPQPAPVQVACP